MLEKTVRLKMNVKDFVNKYNIKEDTSDFGILCLIENYLLSIGEHNFSKEEVYNYYIDEINAARQNKKLRAFNEMVDMLFKINSSANSKELYKLLSCIDGLDENITKWKEIIPQIQNKLKED